MKTFLRAAALAIILCLFYIPVWSQLVKPETSPHLSVRELAVVSARIKNQSDNTIKVNLLLKIGEHLLERLPNASATDSAKTVFDDAERISRKINYDSGVISSLIGNARILIVHREARLQANENDSALFQPIDAIYQQALTFARSKYNAVKLGDLYSRLAELTWRNQYNAPYMQVLFDSAVALYHQAHERDKESVALMLAGLCFHERGRLDSAEARYVRSIDVMQGAKRRGLSMSYSLLGNTYLFRGDTKRALKLFQSAYDLTIEHDDTTDCDFGLVNIFMGFAYQDLKEPDLALKHHLKAMSVFALHDQTNPGDLTHSAANAAKILINKDPRAAIDLLNALKKDHPVVISHRTYVVILARLMSAYMKLHDYQTAQKYYDKVAAILDTKGANAGRPVYPELVNFLIASRQYSEADKHLTNYQKIILGEKPRLSQSYYLRHKLDSAQGNYKAALDSYIKFKLLSDSMMDEAKVKELALLNVSYETEKKEQAIALLKRDAELNEARLRETRLIRNGMIGGTMILAFLLIVMFRLYRGKKKISDQLQVQKDEIVSKNNVLERLINEKEWLLKEVHHRIKNNLHTIVSLLESQAIYLKNTEALSAIQDSQNRVNAMSLIHQKLYQSESVATINMSTYIIELVHCLRESFDHRRGIRFDIQVEDIELDVSQAIPVGLILNEAITNSMKYAFSGPDENIISIHMKEQDIGISLTVADNGIGIPADITTGEKHEGLGLQLIEGLTTDLKGAIQITSSQGVRIEINFVANTRLENVEMT